MRLPVTVALTVLVAGTPQPASAAAWILSLSTYFGGSDMTTATAVAVDGSGDIYVAGWTDSTDRKSTRLNSSHLGISYAVFCLKKKKKGSHRVRGTSRRRPRSRARAPGRRR